MSHAPTSSVRAPVGPVRGALAAVLVVSVANAIVLWVSAPATSEALATRLWHHCYDTGQHLAFALAALGVAALGRRASARFGASIAVFLLLAALLGAALWTDLSIFVQRFASPSLASPVEVALTAVVAATVVGTWHAAHRFGRGWLATAPLLLGLAGLAGHPLVLRGDYPGVHLALATACAAVLAGAVSNVPAPVWLPARVPRGVWLALVAVAAPSVVTRPPNAVLIEMLRHEGSVVAPVVSRLHAGRVTGEARHYDDPRWLLPRDVDATIPPTDVPRSIRDPVVLLVTIDALRFDLLDDPRHRDALPVLRDLARRSVRFSHARAPGAQTVYTLSAVFSGVYFSQQYWSKGAPSPSKPVRNSLFPHEDETLRFPTLLQRAGVRTVTAASAVWLVNEVGIVRGFDEQRYIDPKHGRKYTFAPALTDAGIRRVKWAARSGPAFFFMHYLDPHAPYDRGGGKGTPFERYLAELTYVDTELGRLLGALKKAGLDGRTILIVSSDHGEAFGEHDSRYHATTLYDEVLRVPLLIRIPGIEPHTVDTPVSLVDLGPTVLDIFALPTPGHVMGESLLGLVHGRPSTLSRPIIAEGRLKKSWVFPDQRKLIVDDLTGTVELYDLTRDSGEHHNLADTDPSTDARISSLRAFFDAHRIRRPGYTVPLRR